MTPAVKEQLGAPIYRKWPDTDTTAYRSSPILYKQEKIPLFFPYLEIHYTLAAFCTALQFYLKVMVSTELKFLLMVWFILWGCAKSD